MLPAPAATPPCRSCRGCSGWSRPCPRPTARALKNSAKPANFSARIVLSRPKNAAIAASMWRMGTWVNMWQRGIRDTMYRSAGVPGCRRGFLGGAKCDAAGDGNFGGGDNGPWGGPGRLRPLYREQRQTHGRGNHFRPVLRCPRAIAGDKFNCIILVKPNRSPHEFLQASLQDRETVDGRPALVIKNGLGNR